jgi:SAM-dependent methyltransferase
LRCAACGSSYGCADGIWRLLPPARLEAFSPFLNEYTRIRLAEGRGSDDPRYYQRLPECDPGHAIAWQWNIRRQTFATLCRRILPELGGNLRIVDLGAGVGWLSARLAELGHHPCAIELSVDDYDGLGAARHYRPQWPRMQAEFDRIPLADASADIVLFNAALHYSTDYRTTLAEALRVLRPGGAIVVLETPIYRREESGRQMAAERHAMFEKRFGTRSETMPSIEFLTWGMLDELGRDLKLTWKVFHTWYGWKWAMRPWIARWKGKREPSRFAILMARRAR